MTDHLTALDTALDTASPVDLNRGRAKCPACGRKGLGYAGHPHAFGHKDYSTASCRYCQKRFNLPDGKKQ